MSEFLISFDLESKYCHLYFHLSVEDYFLFYYCGSYYRFFTSLWLGTVAFWLPMLTRPLVQYMREKCGYRLLPYLEDFLIAAAPLGKAATRQRRPKGARALGKTLCFPGNHSTPSGGMLRWWTSDRSSTDARGHWNRARVRRRLQGAKAAKPRKQDYPKGAEKPRSGSIGAREALLWRLHLFGAGDAPRSLSDPEPVLQHHRSEAKPCERPCRQLKIVLMGEPPSISILSGILQQGEALATIPLGSAFLARPDPRQRTGPALRNARPDNAQRRSECLVRRNLKIQHPCAVVGLVGGSRFLDRPQPSRIHKPERAESGTSSASEVVCRISVTAANATALGAQIQPGDVTDSVLYGVEPSRVDVRALKAAKTVEEAQRPNKIPLAAVCGERVRRPYVANRKPRRLAGIRTARGGYFPPVPDRPAVLTRRLSEPRLARVKEICEQL